jgi:hypothetical protein
MGQTMMALRRQDQKLDVVSHLQLDEASLADSLQLAYGARMRAVLHGAARSQARAAQAVAHLERPCLESRQFHRLDGVADIDPSCHLG